jgi:hypothetical protein
VRAQNLEPMLEDEYTVGIEHHFSNESGQFGVLDEWLDGWDVGLHYTYRSLIQTLEDTELSAALQTYCADHSIAGCATAFPTGSEWVLINPGKPVVYQTTELPGTGGALTTITLTPDEVGQPAASREYNAVELVFSRPFDGVWGVDGSYTWMRSTGNYEGGVKSEIGQTDTGLTQDFDQQVSEIGAHGFLPNNRTHTFKIHASYAPVEDVLLGVSGLLQSPRKYGCYGYSPSVYNGVNYDLGSSDSSWFCPVGTAGTTSYGTGYATDGVTPQAILTPRGSQFESQWLAQVDLFFKFTIPQDLVPVDASFNTSIFNVFNSHAKLDFQESGDRGSHVVNPFYGQPTGFETPRYMRFGLELRY